MVNCTITYFLNERGRSMNCVTCKKEMEEIPITAMPLRFKEGPATLYLSVLVPGDKKKGVEPFTPLCNSCIMRAMKAASGSLYQY